MAGVACYFTGDDIAAIHTLMPQIEGALRELTLKQGDETFKYNKGRMERHLLHPIVERIKDSHPEEEDVLSLLDFYLVEVIGPNQRNEVLHGLAEEQSYERIRAEILLLFLLRISSFSLVHPAR